MLGTCSNTKDGSGLEVEVPLCIRLIPFHSYQMEQIIDKLLVQITWLEFHNRGDAMVALEITKSGYTAGNDHPKPVSNCRD